jgi:cytochrome c oxidase subunit 2
LELLWTVIPSLIMLVLFGLTLRTLSAERQAPAEATVVEITGRQWFWEFNYPESEITVSSTSSPLVIPADEPVIFEVRSADVIHSFWVPQLAGKMDAIPGHTNTIWFEADPGTYSGQCAEYCGLQHFAMLFDVEAMPRAEYDRWMDEQIALAALFVPVGTDLETPLPLGNAGDGQVLFNDLGCNACHSLDGSQLVGPTQAGIGQRASERIEGVSAEQYIRESILLPCDYIVSGFTCVMPQNYGERLEAQDLSDLIAFLLGQ